MNKLRNIITMRQWIERLRSEGTHVQELSKNCHYRIDSSFDIYSQGRYHDLKKNKRGDIVDIVDLSGFIPKGKITREMYPCFFSKSSH